MRDQLVDEKSQSLRARWFDGDLSSMYPHEFKLSQQAEWYVGPFETAVSAEWTLQNRVKTLNKEVAKHPHKRHLRVELMNAQRQLQNS